MTTTVKEIARHAGVAPVPEEVASAVGHRPEQAERWFVDPAKGVFLRPELSWRIHKEMR
jgi:hypothetical protein